MPLVGDYAECELFEIGDMSVFYVDALLGQASLEFKGAINGVLTVGGFVVNIDEELESNSGIVGFDRTPTQAQSTDSSLVNVMISWTYYRRTVEQ